MQSVVVYRNPLEAAIWEGLMNGGWLFIIVLLVATLAGVWVYSAIENLQRAQRRQRTYMTEASKSTLVYQLYNHRGKIAMAVTLGLLVFAHLANMRGWL